MSYQAGVSTGPNDLISKLKTFLEAEGWTTNLYAAIGAGFRLHVQKTAADATVMYFNFRSAIAETGTTLITEDNDGGANGTVTGLVINGSTGYDAGELWHVQPGYSKHIGDANKSCGNVMSPMSTTAIPAYYFFTPDSDSDTVHIVVEITAGKFQFMSFGLLVKQGAYIGGQYFTASMSSSRPWYDYQGTYPYDDARYFVNQPFSEVFNGGVYINEDSQASWRNAGRNNTNDEIVFPCVSPGTYAAGQNKEGIAYPFWGKSPNAYNAMAAMCPIYIFLRRPDLNFSLIGWPDGVRSLNVTNYDSGEEITYGAETWTVFHADSCQDTPTNMYVGFAYKKTSSSSSSSSNSSSSSSVSSSHSSSSHSSSSHSSSSSSNSSSSSSVSSSHSSSSHSSSSSSNS